MNETFSASFLVLIRPPPIEFRSEIGNELIIAIQYPVINALCEKVFFRIPNFVIPTSLQVY